MAQNKLREKLIENLIEESKNISPTYREAAILASLDEAFVTKFKPKEQTAISEEDALGEQIEKKAEEDQAGEETTSSANEKAKEKEENEPLPVEEQNSKENNSSVIAINDTLHDGKRPQEETSSKEKDVEGQSRLDKKVVLALNKGDKPIKEEQKEVVPQEEKKEEVSKIKMAIRGTITESVGQAGSAKVPGKFEVFPEDDQFKYRLKANNGEILVVSYGYASRDGAHSGIETLKKNLESGIVNYITDKNGHSQWRLSTSNDSRIIALGETYASLSRAQSAFASTQKFGKTENIVDLDEIPASERREWEFVAEMMGEKENGTIEIYDDGGKFRARLKANNQEVLFVTSQSYATKASLKSALDNIKSKLNANAFHLSKDKQGRYQFMMESGSGFVYMVGESYGTAAAAKSAAASVLAFINKATVNDLTLKSSNVEVTLTGVKK